MGKALAWGVGGVGGLGVGFLFCFLLACIRYLHLLFRYGVRDLDSLSMGLWLVIAYNQYFYGCLLNVHVACNLVQAWNSMSLTMMRWGSLSLPNGPLSLGSEGGGVKETIK